ncbi:MAG: hypothetical protein ACPGVG_10920 [Mycobacterium sp.]
MTVQGFRSATGVLVLSTALLIGSAGGATAVADTGGSDSSSTSSSADSSGADSSGADSSGADSSSAESSSGDASDGLRDSDPTSHSEAESTLSQDDDSAESLAADEAIDEALAAEEADESPVVVEEAVAVSEVEDAGAAGEVDALVAAEHIEDESAADTLATAAEPAAAEAAAPAPEPVVSVSGSNSRKGGSVAALSTEPTSASDESLTAPVAGAGPYDTLTGQDMLAGELEPASFVDPAPLTTMVRTLETVVASLGNAAAAIPPVIWALPFSETPISDVVALLETVLDSVTQSAAAVAQLPRNFVALLGVPTVGAYTAVASETSGHQLPPMMDARIAAAIPAGAPTLLGMAPTQTSDHPVLASSGFATLGPTALAALAAPIQSVPAPIPALTGEYESIFDRAFGALLVPLSLWALATGALPGLVGLFVVFGAGTRVGYRQAKAGFALKMAGISRFAGPGPLGVVRSGSIIAVHQKGVRAKSPRWSRLGDQAA